MAESLPAIDATSSPQISDFLECVLCGRRGFAATSEVAHGYFTVILTAEVTLPNWLRAQVWRTPHDVYDTSAEPIGNRLAA